MSEVMLQQTQVARVHTVWPEFIRAFPTPAAMADAGVARVITAWGRLGYPRRARRLWESARIISRDGWPEDLSRLPGVGRYTAAAVCAQADLVDTAAVEVNIRRVVQRARGEMLSERAAETASVAVGRGLRDRDRLLALMDLGATVCTPRDPACTRCPIRRRCATRGPLAGEVRTRQPKYAGSFRQRRGAVMARLRAEPGVAVGELDTDALASLVDDGLAITAAHFARLP